MFETMAEIGAGNDGRAIRWLGEYLSGRSFRQIAHNHNLLCAGRSRGKRLINVTSALVEKDVTVIRQKLLNVDQTCRLLALTMRNRRLVTKLANMLTSGFSRHNITLDGILAMSDCELLRYRNIGKRLVQQIRREFSDIHTP